MVRIGVGVEELGARIYRLAVVGQLVVKRALQIAEEVHERAPVRAAGVAGEASEDRDRVGEVGTSGEGEPGNGTNGRGVLLGAGGHELDVLRRDRSVGGAELVRGVERGGDRVAVGHAKPLQDVHGVLALRKRQRALAALALNGNAQ